MIAIAPGMDTGAARQQSFGSDRLGVLSRMEAAGGSEGSRLSTLLLPHPDDDATDTDGDGEAHSPRLVGGRDYVAQNLYMVSWLWSISSRIPA